MILFIPMAIYSIIKFLDKKVGLIIDENGITDNSSATSIGLIEWNDITEIRIANTPKFILINVKNPEKYINKTKNKMKAMLMKMNMKMYGTPLIITLNSLKYDFNELLKIIQIKFEENQNASQ